MKTVKEIIFPKNPTKEQELRFMKYLTKLYHDPTSGVAFSSPSTILNKIKLDGKYSNIGLRRLVKYMGNFDGYTGTRIRYNPKRWRRYVNNLIGSALETDLLSVERVASFNDGVSH